MSETVRDPEEPRATRETECRHHRWWVVLGGVLHLAASLVSWLSGC